jgi:hypothetical protein
MVIRFEKEYLKELYEAGKSSDEKHRTLSRQFDTIRGLCASLA